MRRMLQKSKYPQHIVFQNIEKIFKKNKTLDLLCNFYKFGLYFRSAFETNLWLLACFLLFNLNKKLFKSLFMQVRS